MGLIDALKHTSKEHWFESFLCVLISFLGGLLPTWGALFFLRMFSIPMDFKTFTGHAEFALYSASMITGAFYTVTKSDPLLASFWKKVFARFGMDQFYFPRETFPGGRYFGLLFFLLWTLSVFFFTGTTLGQLPGSGLHLDDDFVITGTILLFGFTVLISYIVNVLDNWNLSGSTIGALRRKSFDDLRIEFDKGLGG